MSNWKRNFSNAPKGKQEPYYLTIIHDLTEKNKVLHSCAYTAHSRIGKILDSAKYGVEDPSVEQQLEDLKRELETILMKGTEENKVIVPQEQKVELI